MFHHFAVVMSIQIMLLNFRILFVLVGFLNSTSKKNNYLKKIFKSIYNILIQCYEDIYDIQCIKISPFQLICHATLSITRTTVFGKLAVTCIGNIWMEEQEILILALMPTLQGNYTIQVVVNKVFQYNFVTLFCPCFYYLLL